MPLPIPRGLQELCFPVPRDPQKSGSELWLEPSFLNLAITFILRCCKQRPLLTTIWFRNAPTAEEFFIDVILQKHARRLLSNRSLTDLGYFAAHLDFHLVAWLGKERDRAARVDDFVTVLKHLHEEFQWPYPPPTTLSLSRSVCLLPASLF